MSYTQRLLVCDEVDPMTDRDVSLRALGETTRMILSIPDGPDRKTIFVQGTAAADAIRKSIEMLRGALFAGTVDVLPATESNVCRKAWPKKTTFVDHAVTSESFRKSLALRQACFA